MLVRHQAGALHPVLGLVVFLCRMPARFGLQVIRRLVLVENRNMFVDSGEDDEIRGHMKWVSVAHGGRNGEM